MKGGTQQRISNSGKNNMRTGKGSKSWLPHASAHGRCAASAHLQGLTGEEPNEQKRSRLSKALHAAKRRFQGTTLKTRSPVEHNTKRTSFRSREKSGEKTAARGGEKQGAKAGQKSGEKSEANGGERSRWKAKSG